MIEVKPGSNELKLEELKEGSKNQVDVNQIDINLQKKTRAKTLDPNTVAQKQQPNEKSNPFDI